MKLGRCAACNHEGKPKKDRDGSHSCTKCGSYDVFECGTPESDAEWEEAEDYHYHVEVPRQHEIDENGEWEW